MDQATLAKLVEAVKQALSEGKSIEEITQSLLNAGYTQEEIDQVMAAIAAPAATAAEEAPTPEAEPTTPAPTPTGAAPVAGGVSRTMIAGGIAVIAIIAVVALTMTGPPAAAPEEVVTPSVPKEPGAPETPEAAPPAEEEAPPETEEPETAEFFCGDGICYDRDKEDCSVCVSDCGVCPWLDEPPPQGAIPDYCADKSLKDDCIRSEAKEKEDESICAALLNPDSWRESTLEAVGEDTYRTTVEGEYNDCVGAVAKKKMDTSVCAQTWSASGFGRCVQGIVRESHAEKDCEALWDYATTKISFDYVDCIGLVAFHVRDSSLCDSINDRPYQTRLEKINAWELCHIDAARGSGDESLCDPIEGESEYRTCVAVI